MNFARLETSNATRRASQCLRFKLLEVTTVSQGKRTWLSSQFQVATSGSAWLLAVVGCSWQSFVLLARARLVHRTNVATLTIGDTSKITVRAHGHKRHEAQKLCNARPLWRWPCLALNHTICWPFWATPMSTNKEWDNLVNRKNKCCPNIPGNPLVNHHFPKFSTFKMAIQKWPFFFGRKSSASKRWKSHSPSPGDIWPKRGPSWIWCQHLETCRECPTKKYP